MEIYDAIYKRRDVREFRKDAIPDEALIRILDAAHHAGSVGFMQPWNFLVVKSQEIRGRIFEIVQKEHERGLVHYEGKIRELYQSLRHQGILDAPLNIAVTCDPNRGGPHVYGRHTIPQTDVYSTCCAIQNLWLAARAEEIGVNWISVIDNEATKRILGIPPDIILVAYLCVGYPTEFASRPLLEHIGWRNRTPLKELVFSETWGTDSGLF